MPYTNDFKDMTDLDPTMSRKAQQEVLLAAVQRNITCQITGVVLDRAKAVLVVPSEGPMAIMCADVWDRSQTKVVDACEASGVTFEVYDGRELW
jgi:hypothetical protein